ncbi:MAG: relaxase domain-containing protein [Thermoanaerobaculia bacterium]|nr:relaxase domain-containing protein [Thermoanaerobaculia bacterium]
MLRIVPSQSGTAAKSYFDRALAPGDYYLDGEELAGSWGGRAAELLGLSGEVTREAFHALCDNHHPTSGEQLTPRMNAKRRVGYDFNFHCPKGVSAVFALTRDDRILHAFRRSVEETMRELEQDSETRVRTDGRFESRTTSNMVWGEFVHFTSRPVDGTPDPHLHAHCFAMNATWDVEESRWKAADFGSIKRDASVPIDKFRE